MPLAIGAPGLPELLILLVVVLLVLGPKRLTGVGRALGSNAKDFKDSITGHDDDERPKDLAAAPQDTDETVTGEPVDEPRRTPRS